MSIIKNCVARKPLTPSNTKCTCVSRIYKILLFTKEINLESR